MENMVNMEKLDISFWKNKKVLVTGHTGFKGSWLTIWLNSMGANTHGISLKPEQNPSLFKTANVVNICNSFFCDIRDYEKFKKIIKEIKPDIIFHLAAQPLVKVGYESPINTFSTNIMGSVNILNISRDIDNLKSFILITTDKVYKNNEWTYPYRENDSLGGSDPYSSSKASVELILNSFRESFFKDKNIKLFSVRAGNVIGGGDWSKHRIIPDAIRAWESNNCLEIRRPYFIRPWQHVLEPIFGYLLLAQKSFKREGLENAYNFGPNSSELISVKQLIELSSKYYENAKFVFNDKNLFQETGTLLLDNSLAKRDIEYLPRWDVFKSVEKTIKWYRKFYSGAQAYELCLSDIKAFENK